MAFTVQDFGDLLRLLEEHPEWRSELRRHVVSDELLELPALVRALVEAQRSTDKRIERLTEQLKGLAQRVDHLAVQVEALVQVQMRTEQRLTDLDARYRGDQLEDRYREHSSAYFGRLLRRLRVHAPSTVVDQYEERLPREAMLDLLEADLLVHGQVRDAPERGDVWLVVEVSTTVDSHDVQRAVRRAAALRQAGLRVLPAVAGEQATPTAIERVHASNVVLFRDGSVTGWDEALAGWAS